MLRVTRRCALTARTRLLCERAFDSSHSSALPGTDNSLMGKVKAEAKKMLRIQLFLIPICVVALVFLFPTPSAEEEKRMREEYERNAGWKTTARGLFIMRLRRLRKAPVFGYEVAELPNERVLRDYMQHHRTKGVLVILHSGLDTANVTPATTRTTTTTTLSDDEAAARSFSSSNNNAAKDKSSTSRPATTTASSGVACDPLMRAFVSSLNNVNLGSPEEVKVALVPGPHAPRLVSDYHVLTYPTTLLFLDGACVYRCVGACTEELATKSLFMLRNADRDIFACK